MAAMTDFIIESKDILELVVVVVVVVVNFFYFE